MDVWEIDRIRPQPSRPEVLRSDDGIARIIAVAIPRGERLADHEVHEHTWLMVLEGLLDVSCGQTEIEIGQGAMLHFDPGERRTLRAKSNATIIYALVPWPGAGHPSLLASAAGLEDPRD